MHGMSKNEHNQPTSCAILQTPILIPPCNTHEHLRVIAESCLPA